MYSTCQHEDGLQTFQSTFRRFDGRMWSSSRDMTAGKNKGRNGFPSRLDLYQPAGCGRVIALR